MIDGNIIIAIPNKGRLRESALNLLKKAGFKFFDVNDRLFVRTNREDVDIISVRSNDIPEYVQDGAADVGITGGDLVYEKNADVKIIMGLGFGFCKLVLAAPENSGIDSVQDIKSGSKIATKFVNSSRRYFRKEGKDVEIVGLTGALEVTPIIGVADAIVDLTSTGSTLKTHNLKVVDTLFESEAVLIANKESLKKSVKNEFIDDLVLAIRGVVQAAGKKYLMVNLPEENLPKLESISGGLLSPTIMKLDKKGWIAAHMVVGEEKIFDIIKEIKGIGGRDLLVLPIERLVS